MKFVNQQETVKTQLEGGVWELGPNVLSERGEKKKKKLLRLHLGVFLWLFSHRRTCQLQGVNTGGKMPNSYCTV